MPLFSADHPLRKLGATYGVDLDEVERIVRERGVERVLADLCDAAGVSRSEASRLALDFVTPRVVDIVTRVDFPVVGDRFEKRQIDPRVIDAILGHVRDALRKFQSA